MSTYRERRERRAERLETWSAGHEVKAEEAHAKVHAIADGIPFGQPILVGHHSERHARRDQARMEAGMRASIDHSRTASDQASRAETIRAQDARAIYSDDADALERLEARIAELEAERQRIKAYNASCRKGARDVSLLDEKQREDLVVIARVASYQLGARGEFPAYALQNLGGNINRQKKRLEQLRRARTPGAKVARRMLSARYAGACDRCGAAVERGATIYFARGAEEPVLCGGCFRGGHDGDA